jgi:hypothetical protein
MQARDAVFEPDSAEVSKALVRRSLDEANYGATSRSWIRFWRPTMSGTAVRHVATRSSASLLGSR